MSGWQKKHRGKHAARQRAYRIERKKQVLKAIGQEACSVCGEDRAWVLHLHHSDPQEKEFSPMAKLMKLPIEDIIAEARKCVCLCATCHADIHYLGPRD